MAGTKEGGKKAAMTAIQKYGPDYHRKLMSNAGRQSTTGGFASESIGPDGLTGPQRAKIVGGIAGKASRRRSKQNDGI